MFDNASFIDTVDRVVGRTSETCYICMEYLLGSYYNITILQEHHTLYWSNTKWIRWLFNKDRALQWKKLNHNKYDDILVIIVEL